MFHAPHFVSLSNKIKGEGKTKTTLPTGIKAIGTKSSKIQDSVAITRAGGQRFVQKQKQYTSREIQRRIPNETDMIKTI